MTDQPSAVPPSDQAFSTMDAKPGSKLMCTHCGTQVVLVRPLMPELSCCGAVLTPPA